MQRRWPDNLQKEASGSALHEGMSNGNASNSLAPSKPM